MSDLADTRVVALGGGHGLAASLTALRTLTDHLTAVVTVADDGGSSGKLRTGYGLLPPGDLRMALAALTASDPEHALLGDLLQHRFPPGGQDVAGLEGHPVGNLLLSGLMQLVGDPVAALAAVGAILGLPPGCQVLPLATVPLDLTAEVSDAPLHDAPGSSAPVSSAPVSSAPLTADPLISAAGGDPPRIVRGQVAIATTSGRVLGLQVWPTDARACPQALAAVAAADVLVLGPGSLFTSVLPHLMLPDMQAAVTQCAARRILVLNLAPEPGETEGFLPAAHLQAFAQQVPQLRVDVVLADATRVLDRHGLMGGLAAAAEDLGARVHYAPLARSDRPEAHDPVALAAAFADILRA